MLHPHGDSVLLDHQDPSLSGVQNPGSRLARDRDRADRVEDESLGGRGVRLPAPLLSQKFRYRFESYPITKTYGRWPAVGVSLTPTTPAPFLTSCPSGAPWLTHSHALPVQLAAERPRVGEPGHPPGRPGDVAQSRTASSSASC